MTSRPRTVLITGASSGIGAEFARQFARRGSALVLVARREDRLRDLAARITRDHGVQVDVVALDLEQDGAADRLHQHLAEAGIRIDGLVNNAGFGIHGPLATNDPSRLEALLRLNVGALVALTRIFIPDILAAQGVLINVASTAAYQPCPGMAAYAASKAFVLSFTEAIAYEARGSGARILALSPGGTRTEFFDVLGTDSVAVGRLQTSEQVVACALRALDARTRPSSVASANKMRTVLVRLLPRRTVTAIAGRMLN